jgi:ABC-2 type transport system permease protein
MRLLDQVRLREEKSLWQWLNVLAPLVVLALFGILYNLLRQRRYARS